MARPWVKQFIVDRVGNILGPDERYGVLEDLVTIAVRGKGEEVLEDMLD